MQGVLRGTQCQRGPPCLLRWPRPPPLDDTEIAIRRAQETLMPDLKLLRVEWNQWNTNTVVVGFKSEFDVIFTKLELEQNGPGHPLRRLLRMFNRLPPELRQQYTMTHCVLDLVHAWYTARGCSKNDIDKAIDKAQRVMRAHRVYTVLESHGFTEEQVGKLSESVALDLHSRINDTPANSRQKKVPHWSDDKLVEFWREMLEKHPKGATVATVRNWLRADAAAATGGAQDQSMDAADGKAAAGSSADDAADTHVGSSRAAAATDVNEHPVSNDRQVSQPKQRVTKRKTAGAEKHHQKRQQLSTPVPHQLSRLPENRPGNSEHPTVAEAGAEGAAGAPQLNQGRAEGLPSQLEQLQRENQQLKLKNQQLELENQQLKLKLNVQLKLEAADTLLTMA